MLRPLLHAAALCLIVGSAQAQALPALNLQSDATTASGLSSGAFMTVQLQVAFSERIAGAGVVAGGPYDCADGLVWRALNVCMKPFFVDADPARSFDDMTALADEGVIDPIAGLRGDRIYLFHGQADTTVARSTMDALRETYRMADVPDTQIAYETQINAGHGFVTEAGEWTCATTKPDFLVDCDYDQAGAILTQLYGPLADPVLPRDAGFQSFDQSLYANEARGIGTEAFVYVPRSCAQGTRCRLHIALHGCKQSRERIGDLYARTTGYNQWAEANNIVVLYPQAEAVPVSFFNFFGANPDGCWDWWGYSSKDYLSRSAPQLAAIARMADALGAPLTP